MGHCMVLEINLVHYVSNYATKSFALQKIILYDSRTLRQLFCAFGVVFHFMKNTYNKIMLQLIH